MVFAVIRLLLLLIFPVIAWGAPVSSNDTKQVKISSADTTPKFLENKIVAGDNITITKQNTGANETLSIAAVGGIGATGATGATGSTGATGATGPQGDPASNLITSVAADDSTLTVTPTTGDVKAKINLGNSNIWTAVQTIRRALGATSDDGFTIDNTTAATSGNQKASPALKWCGNGWKTQSVAASQSICFRIYNLPVQGTTNPSGRLILERSVNGGTWTAINEWKTTGATVQTVSTGETIANTIDFSASNSAPGTTAHQRYTNPGTGTWIEFLFSGILRGAFGLNSSGLMSFFSSGNNGFYFYNGVTSPSLFAYLWPSGFVHSSGYGAFANGVNAGSQSSPSSTLDNQGNLGLQILELTSNTTLSSGSQVTQILCDPSTNACAGTPTRACGYWTNSTDCALRSNHGGGCSWYAGTDCSTYNGDIYNCSNQVGCTVSTSSCAGPSDQYNCESQDDTYGGSCAWVDTMPSCSSFDESTCNSYSMLGCTTNYFSCSSLSNTTDCNNHSGCSASVSNDCSGLSDGGGDGTNCATQPECSYDSGTGSCSGSYFSSCDGMPFESCSGNYSSYECQGSYNTGSCTGSFGAQCQGSPACSPLSESDCPNELGCAWQTSLTVTLFAGVEDRTLWATNIAAGGADCILTAAAGEDIGASTGSSTCVLSDADQNVHLAFKRRTASCDVYDNNQSSCTATGTCGWTGCDSYDNTSQESCEGAGCSWSDPDCSGSSGDCSGNYFTAKRWYVMGGACS